MYNNVSIYMYIPILFLSVAKHFQPLLWTQSSVDFLMRYLGTNAFRYITKISLYKGNHVTAYLWFFLWHLLLTWFTFIPSMDKNYIYCEVWDEITYLFPNSGYTVEVWEWIRNFIHHCTIHVIIHPCWDKSQTILVTWSCYNESRLYYINSSPPSATYMRQWTGSQLLQIMACHKLQWNLNQNTKLFIQDNAFENIVCEMMAILSRGSWVNAPQRPLAKIRGLFLVLLWKTDGNGDK